MTPKSVGANLVSLMGSLGRLTVASRTRGLAEPVFKCRCQDTGWVAKTEGTYDVANDVHQPGRHAYHHASSEVPVMVRCEACNPRRVQTAKTRKYGDAA